MEYAILIEPDGSIAFVYSDELAEVFAGQPMKTQRASHVEPYLGGWSADMRPSGGPVLLARHTTVYGGYGGTSVTYRPFPTRQAALDAELAWLRKEKLL